MTNDILFSTINGLAKITLNRPNALNALSKDMFVRMHDQLLEWQSDASIKAVLIRSAVEKAFCAGGDVRAIYENKQRSLTELLSYFQLEYETNKIICHYQKPIIALTHGITMGGGVGISVHASHCVAAENVRWAMPETVIGFFPDVGATYYLSRLPNNIGTYLALTGEVIHSEVVKQLNLIKTVVRQQDFDALEEKLSNMIFESTDAEEVSAIIKEFEFISDHSIVVPNEKEIAECFCFSTIEDIFSALHAHSSEWAKNILSQLQKRSPTSLKVTLQQLQFAKNKNVDEVLEMDLHIAYTMLTQHDFYEGVRAAIIDKDKNPKWTPDSINGVSDLSVRKYFLEKFEMINAK